MKNIRKIVRSQKGQGLEKERKIAILKVRKKEQERKELANQENKLITT